MSQTNVSSVRDVSFYDDFEKAYTYTYRTARVGESYCNRSTSGTSQQSKQALFAQQEFIRRFVREPGVRGLLVYHGLGSGKTCTSIAAAIDQAARGRDTAVFLPAFLRGNYEAEIETCRPDGVLFRGMRPEKRPIFSYNSSNVQDTLYAYYECEGDSDDARFNDLLVKMRSTLIIIDEAHHLVQAMHNALVLQRRDSIGHFFYELLMRAQDTKVLLLTGTPLTNFAFEAAVLGNVLTGYVGGAGRTLFPENADAFYRQYLIGTELRGDMRTDFERRFVGLVSYLPSIADPAVFPVVRAHHEYRCVLAGDQLRAYAAYAAIEAEEERMQARRKNRDTQQEKSSTFKAKTRMAGNFVFPESFYQQFLQRRTRDHDTLRKTLLQLNVPGHLFLSYKDLRKLFESRGVAYFHDPVQKRAYFAYIESYVRAFGDEIKTYLTDLANVSAKYEVLRNNIANTQGKTVVYSFFKSYAGARSIEWVLRTLGYERLGGARGPARVEEERTTRIDDVLDNMGAAAESANPLGGVDATPYSDTASAVLPRRPRYAVFEGTREQKEAALAAFNSRDNTDGSRVRVLIISSAGSEGINLRAVRHVHVMEPYWNQNRTDQVIGRARRLCSHADLPLEERDVTVHTYIAVTPDGAVTTDEHIRGIARQKEDILAQVYDVFRDVAIDCAFRDNTNDTNGTGDRLRCFRARHDLRALRTGGAHKWYDYYYRGTRMLRDISQDTETRKHRMIPLVNETDLENPRQMFIAREMTSGAWSLYVFDNFFQRVGLLVSRTVRGEPRLYIEYEDGTMSLHYYRKSDIVAYKYIEIVNTDI